MPKILKRLTSQLKDKGHSTSAAYAIATSKLQKAGHLRKGTNKATVKGAIAGSKTPSQRAKQRASKLSGRPKSQYNYSSRTNRATLKRGK